MTHNFKSIADVETVAEPSESANVLIEENGFIKKAPKTAVGGAVTGATEPDMVIAADAGTMLYSSTSKDNLKVVSGSYDNVVAKLRAGELVDVRLRECYIPGFDYICNEFKARCYDYDGWLYCNFVFPSQYGNHLISMSIRIYENNVIDGVDGGRIEFTY